MSSGERLSREQLLRLLESGQMDEIPGGAVGEDRLTGEYAAAFTDPESRAAAEDWDVTTGDGVEPESLSD